MPKAQLRVAARKKPKAPASEGSLAIATLRMPSALKARLDMLKDLKGVPMNKLMVAGLTLYADQETLQLERSLEGSLAALRAHRKADPYFSKDAQVIAEEEAAAGRDDPAQGVMVREMPSAVAETGSALRFVQSVIGAA